MKYDVVIVGGGIAGLTAAAYTSKAGRSVLILEKQTRTGGLVQTFNRNGVFFDSGLRSIEDSGIVLPMLRQLGIEIDFLPSPVSVGIGNQVLRLKDHSSIGEYEAFLIGQFPGYEQDVRRIIREINKIMKYMDVLYGLDNPAFMNMMEDKKYLLTVVLPWVFRFLITIRKINKLYEPVEDYLKRLTNHQPLIDMIAQHFFQKTPTSFALSYFRLYLDYHYPKGGTAVLIDKLDEFVRQHGGQILTDTTVESVHPEEKFVTDTQGNRFEYNQLIWAGDLKGLYNSVPLDALQNPELKQKISERKASLKDLRGGDSVYSLFLTVSEDPAFFARICTGHFFYTPKSDGLSKLSKAGLDAVMAANPADSGNEDLKNKIREYLREYCELNTFEISIPTLRDPDLAPEGTTGLIVSLLFDYELAKKLDELGWTAEMREFTDNTMIRILDESIFPGMAGKIAGQFSSSPLTLERLTGNTHGGITGWAFTNPHIPVVHKMLQVSKSVKTPIPDVYQAGQWTYSPSGLPIAILTGKLAADQVNEAAG